MNLAATLQQRFFRWALRGPAPEATPVLLTRRRVFVLPTRCGLSYGLLLLVMLVAAINYDLSLAYALVFLLGSLGVVCIFHSYRNLAQISIAPGRTAPAFAGEDARFALILHNPGGRPRPALRLALPGQPEVEAHIPPWGDAKVTLKLPARSRGWLPMPRLRVATVYPLGMIRAWAYAAPDLRCLVYPAVHRQAAPAHAMPSDDSGVAGRSAGFEDFSGLRQHHPADPLRHVAWKAAAHSEQGPLLTKQFDGGLAQTVWLDFDLLPQAADLETRLSMLARGVCDAQAAGHVWGLRLPERALEPSSGDEHYAACMAALALHGQGRP